MQSNNTYRVEYWYRSGDEKYHNRVDIEAESEEDAHNKAKRLRKNIFKTFIIN